MDQLPEAVATFIAAQLVDERDLASLRSTSRFWRDVLASPALWRTLLERRFGAAGAAGVSIETPLQRLFQSLASLRLPVPLMDRIIWLDGQHLQVVSEPGSTAGTAVKVHDVAWLELACRFTGVLPGRYCAAWRLRLQGHFRFSGGRLVARQLPTSSPAAAAAAALGGDDPLLPILREDGVRGTLRDNAAPEPPDARSTLTLVTSAQLHKHFQEVGSDYFELTGGAFDVAQTSLVYLKFHAPQGFTSGVVFDCARLKRL